MSGSPQNVAPTDEAGIPKQKDLFADFFKLYVLPAPKHSIHVTDLRELIRKVFPKHFGKLSDVTPTVTSAIKSAHKKVKDNLTKNEHEALMADGSDAWLYRSKNGAPCVLYGMDIRKEPTNHMKTTSAYIHIRKYALTCLLDDMDVTFEKIKQEREDAEEAAKDNKKTTTKPNTKSKTKVKADTKSAVAAFVYPGHDMVGFPDRVEIRFDAPLNERYMQLVSEEGDPNAPSFAGRTFNIAWRRCVEGEVGAASPPSGLYRRQVSLPEGDYARDAITVCHRERIRITQYQI